MAKFSKAEREYLRSAKAYLQAATRKDATDKQVDIAVQNAITRLDQFQDIRDK